MLLWLHTMALNKQTQHKVTGWGRGLGEAGAQTCWAVDSAGDQGLSQATLSPVPSHVPSGAGPAWHDGEVCSSPVRALLKLRAGLSNSHSG